MRLVDYVVVVVLVAAGVAIAVGLGRRREAQEPVVARADPEVAEARRKAFEQVTTRRLDDLTARLTALEGAPIREGAPPAEAWSEAHVEALRVGLERVRIAEQRSRDAQRLRQVVQRIVPDAEPAVRDETVARLLEAIRAARGDPEQAEAVRAAVLEDLADAFPEPIAQRLAGLVPVDPEEQGAR